MKTTIVGTAIKIPSKYAMEVKELHDKLIRLKGKAHHLQTYLLWTRVHALVPETRKGTWSLRHSKVEVYLVKLSEQDED